MLLLDVNGNMNGVGVQGGSRDIFRLGAGEGLKPALGLAVVGPLQLSCSVNNPGGPGLKMCEGL